MSESDSQHSDPQPTARRGDPWTSSEVDLIVVDYFDMLRAELLALPVNKAEHYRALSPRLHDRSKSSIEFKHQNISAVLVQIGYPYIDGYKPLGNYQKILMEAVVRYIAAHDGFFGELLAGPVLDPTTIAEDAQLYGPGIFEPPPDRIDLPLASFGDWRGQSGRRIDFVRRDAQNRRLGRLGEQFVINLERRRLATLGRNELAEQVECVSKTRGDGLGFDVLSFEEDSTERLIEVKASGLGKYFPFYVTSTEVRCSERYAPQYHLYRVFNVATAPRVFDLPGALSTTCKLAPVQYQAYL